jgi:transcriptional regulator with GAF, ATPase, and Fis domain
VLITGETGCGKELAALAIHQRSQRRGKPLVSLNCAAIQESLVESELFGHERGAFTGAAGSKAGLLETASGSTLFLDEIGELSLAVQAKLLRVLETQRVTRVGDVREREVDVRVVAATNRDPAAEVAAGRFRSDLYYRLSGAVLHLPPLRERPRELPLLAAAFLDEACARAERAPMIISEGAMNALIAHSWPGNVRELKNLMHYVAAAHQDDELTAAHVIDRLGGPTARPKQAEPPPADADPTFRPLAEEIRELERERIRAALEASGGNQTRAAQLLSMPVRTFFEKVKQYELTPRRRRRADDA